MRTRWRTLGSSIVLLLFLLAAPAAANERHVVVIHTNDVHGQVLPRPATWLKDVDVVPNSGGLPRLAAGINRLRREAEAEGAVVVVCDGGDWFQGTPEGQVERGLAFLRALAEVGYDGMVVGNHEFDHGVDVFLSHMAAVPMPAMLANARDAGGNALVGTTDHRVVERGGMRIALVGLLTPSTPAITHRSTRDLAWEQPADALRRIRDELGASVDLVIPVTHLGVENDVTLAKAHPDLPLIVGGHSHTFLRKGIREGSTLIVQAGAKASVVGRVDLWFDGDGNVTRSEGRHVDLYEEPADAERNERVEALCRDVVEAAAGRLDQVVGVLGRPLEQSRRELFNSTAGNFIADIVRERSGAHVAIHNRGGIRTSLPAGPVTRRDLFMLLPFDNTLTTLEISGADLVELFRRSIEDERRTGLEFSGAVVRARRVEGKPKFVALLVGGEEVDPKETYRLATNSFLAGGGDGWELLADQGTRELDAIVLRDLLELAFDGGPLTPSNESRYEVVR